MLLTIENSHDSENLVENLRVVLNHEKFKIKSTSFLDLDQIMTHEICELIINKIGLDSRENNTQINLTPGKNVTFVLELYELLEPEFVIILQFKSKGKIFVQRLPLNLDCIEPINDIGESDEN